MRIPGILFGLILISNASVFAEKAITADARLIGAVRDSSSGAPISGAKVKVLGTRLDGGPFSDSTLTGTDGEFEMSGLKPEQLVGSRYVLSIMADRYWIFDYPIVQIMPGETKRFDKDLFKMMSQIILIKEKGAPGPLPDARVTWRYREPRMAIRVAKSDAEGRAVLQNLVQSPSPVTVAAVGFRTRTFIDTLKGPGWTDTVSLELEREAADQSKSIVGSIFTNGQPIDRFPLYFTCTSSIGASLLDAEIRTDGSFNLAGISASCSEGTLFSNPGTQFAEGGAAKSISLLDPITRIDINFIDPPTSLRSGKQRMRSSSGMGSVTRYGIREGFNVLGRKKSEFK
jgi:carboxypeptidase family protein